MVIAGMSPPNARYRKLDWRNQPEEIAAAVRRSVIDTASDGSNNDCGT